MSTTTPSIDQLKRAISISEQIQALEAELASILGGIGESSARAAVKAVASSSSVKAAKGKRTLSPEARARIVAAQKARWAKARGEEAPVTEAAPKPRGKKAASGAKGKRVVSEEARARMAASARNRWAKSRKNK